MSAPSKVHNIRLVELLPDDWLAATTELNLHKNMVMGCYEANEVGYWEGAHGNLGADTLAVGVL